MSTTKYGGGGGGIGEILNLWKNSLDMKDLSRSGDPLVAILVRFRLDLVAKSDKIQAAEKNSIMTAPFQIDSRLQNDGLKWLPNRSRGIQNDAGDLLNDLTHLNLEKIKGCLKTRRFLFQHCKDKAERNIFSEILGQNLSIILRKSTAK